MGVFAAGLSSRHSVLRQQYPQQYPQHQQHRKTQVSVFPQEIFRLEEPKTTTTTTTTTTSVSTSSQIHHRGINRPPTPAPVAAKRPTPAPVVRRTTPAPVARPTPQPVSPTGMGMTPQSMTTSSGNNSKSSSSSSSSSTAGTSSSSLAATKASNLPNTQPPTQKPISPWADVNDQQVEIEIGQDTSDANNDNNNDNNEENDQPSSPFFWGYCTNIRNQNHKAILNKQEEGLAGPTYLYSIQVFVVYDETLVTKEEVPESLDNLNVPVAMSVSSCEKNSKRQLQEEQQSNNNSSSSSSSHSTSTTPDLPPAEVEYAEVESWRPSSETTVGCAPSPQIEGLVCNVFRSRAIVFLVDNQNATSAQRQEEFQQKTQAALDAETARVTKNPGILAFDVHSIESVALANNNHDNTNNNSNNNIIGAQSSNANASFPWLSEKEQLVVGSVAAGIGGLLIGMICMVRLRRSSRCASNKHLKMNDNNNNNGNNDDDDGSLASTDEEWSPPRIFTPSEIEEDLAHTFDAMAHRGDSLYLPNRDNSLLDDSKARLAMGPKRRGTTIHDRRRARGWEDEFGISNNANHDNTNYHYCDYESPQRQSYIENTRCCSEERPCSAATCVLCENVRTSGIGKDEYLWLKELLPASPERVPSYDPNRPCLCSDTVQL